MPKSTDPLPAQSDDTQKKKDEKEPPKRKGTPPPEDQPAKKKDELSEEDQRIKDEVALLVTRAQDKDQGVAAMALQTLADMLRTASGTVASIPKPLKFVRPAFQDLRAYAEQLPATVSHRRLLYDVLSFIAMTLELPEANAVVNLKLLGTSDDISVWGHEYLHHLASGISSLWGSRTEAGESTDDLAVLLHQSVVFFMAHADEAAAIDLAMEIGEASKIIEYTDDANCGSVVQYLVSIAPFFPAPEDDAVFEVAFQVCMKHNLYPQALRIALMTHSKPRVEAIFGACTDAVQRKQLALCCGQARHFHTTDDEELDDLIGNVRLSEWYRLAARELDSLAPKSPEEVYKEHLMEKNLVPNTANSHMHNLASTFVNAFVNAGYGKDKLTTDEGSNWIYRTKDHRMMSAAASLGMLHLWDADEGIAAVDKYSYAEDNYIKAGALLATGMVMTGVRSQFDPALGLLSEHVSGVNREMRLGAILGLGFAYAGMEKPDVQELLVPLVADNSQPFEVQAMAAYALSLVYCGSCNEDASEVTMMCLMDKTPKQLAEPCVRYLVLALGFLFLASKDKADTLIEATKALPDTINKYAKVVITSCAYAASGNVVVVQELFKIVSERKGDTDDADEVKDAVPGASGAAATDDEPSTSGPADADGTPVEPLNYKAAAALGIGAVAMGEDLGMNMAKRGLLHALLSKEESATSGRRGVPLALALLHASDPQMPIIDHLSKLSHDTDVPTAQAATLGIGIASAGSNNARVAGTLRNLTGYYSKDTQHQHVFVCRLAQALLSLGKGHVTVSPRFGDGLATNLVGLAGVLTLCHSALDLQKTLLDKYHYMMYSVVLAVNPRMLLTVNPDLEPVTTQVRVGQAVDTVTLPGKPKTITGFQTHQSPVLLSLGERAELVPGKYQPVGSVLEGVAIVREKEVKEGAE